MARLEAELAEKMLEAPTQSNLVGAGLLLENLRSQLNQAIIFDKTIRHRLEADLEAMRLTIAGANSNAGIAQEQLRVFREVFRSNFSHGQIV